MRPSGSTNAGAGRVAVASESPLPSVSASSEPNEDAPEPRQVLLGAPGEPAAAGWHVPVLMYHLVATPAEAGDAIPSLVVPPGLFAAQMGELHLAGWHTITAASLAADLYAGRRPAAKTFVVTFDDGHEDGYSEAYPILQANGFVGTYFMVTGRTGRAGYLTPAQLSAMAATGMEIADHTVDHVALAAVPRSVAFTEVVGALVFLEQLLGVRPTTLAYPYGSTDAAVIAGVKAEGFMMAFSNREGCFESGSTRFDVPRLRVSPSTSPLALLDRVRACGFP
jgi:peptidoglycan/xylan/chitin deacetylase (PgdA/CDA1 family)